MVLPPQIKKMPPTNWGALQFQLQLHGNGLYLVFAWLSIWNCKSIIIWPWKWLISSCITHPQWVPWSTWITFSFCFFFLLMVNNPKEARRPIKPKPRTKSIDKMERKFLISDTCIVWINISYQITLTRWEICDHTWIWLSVIKASNSFSSPETVVLKAPAIVCRSTEINGCVYWMMALWRIWL